MKFASDELIAELATRIGDEALVAAVEQVYADLAAEQAERNAQETCTGCGQCCRFSQFGHCLFVTSPELVHFLTRWNRLDGGTRTAGVSAVRHFAAHCLPGQNCPLQAGAGCPVRLIRPLGCRVYFCAESLTDWTRSVYERLQAGMRHVCQTHCLPYAYIEWTSALKLAESQQSLTL